MSSSVGMAVSGTSPRGKILRSGRSWTIAALIDDLQTTYGTASALAFADDEPTGSYTVLSFADLAREVRKRATALRDFGVQREDILAAMLPLTKGTYPTLLAAMTVATPMPINYFLEAEALVELIRATGASWLISTGSAADDATFQQKIALVRRSLPNLKHIIFEAEDTLGDFDLDDALPKLNSERWPDDEHGGNSSRIAIIFHTGGSTGQPKLVPYSEEMISDVVAIGGRGTCQGPGEIMIGGMPLFHVGGALVAGIIPLFSGSHLVIPSRQGFRDKRLVENYWQVVYQHKATISASVPTALAAVCKIPIKHDIDTLRCFIAGGGALPIAIIQSIREAAPGVDVLEGWGMTETSGLCTLNPLGNAKAGSAGLPFPGVSLRIQTSTLLGYRACGVDEIGELLVKGPSVISRYGTPIPDAFTADGWLKTGDLAKLDADGYLWITGREKDLIIRGGHNIDPKTIEDPACQHPAVRLAAAVGYPDRYAGELPILFVELEPGVEVTENEILEFIRDRIAERAATPKKIIILSQMPLTGPGKISKLSLRGRAAAEVLQGELNSLTAQSRHCLTAVYVQDPREGMVIEIELSNAVQPTNELVASVQYALSSYTIPYRWRAQIEPC